MCRVLALGFRHPAAAAVRLVLLAALLGGGTSAQPVPVGARPNVVLLVADDLGYGDLGAYGSPDARTPHLDALAAEGLRFTDFYAGGPVCTPSRYALLTGLHTFRAGDDHLLEPLYVGTGNRSGLSDEVVTLAEALKGEGYETALIGKWHLGHGNMPEGGAPDTRFHPLYHGFDTFFGSIRGGIDYNTHWHQDDFLDWWEGRRLVPEDSLLYATHVFGDRAVDFLDAHAGAGTTEPPFFLYLPVTAPHYGNTANTGARARMQLPVGEEQEREYLSRFDDLYPDDDHIRKRFLAMTAVLDDEVGRIVEALERNGLRENTLVWVLSDNGAALRLGGSNGALRGQKKEPYEGGIRVPSFVVWPDRIAPGATAQLGSHTDVFPTVVALAGGALTHGVDGLDLSTYLLGGSPVARGVAVPNTHYGDAYRLRDWKYVRHYGPGARTALYDLAANPAEATDLSAVYPDTLALLEALMPYGSPPPPTGEEPPPNPLLTATLRVVPNPAPGDAAAHLELIAPVAGAVRVEVFDALGRRLALLYDGPLNAGTNTLALPTRRPPLVVVRATGPFGTLTARAIRVR